MIGSQKVNITRKTKKQKMKTEMPVLQARNDMDSLCAWAKARHNAVASWRTAGGDWTTEGYRAGHASELNRPLPLKGTESNVWVYTV
jgi:hypothetical protein